MFVCECTISVRSSELENKIVGLGQVGLGWNAGKPEQNWWQKQINRGNSEACRREKVTVAQNSDRMVLPGW